MYSWTSRLCAEGRGLLRTPSPVHPLCKVGMTPKRHRCVLVWIIKCKGAGKGNTGSLLTAEGAEALRAHQEAQGHAVLRGSVSRVRWESTGCLNTHARSSRQRGEKHKGAGSHPDLQPRKPARPQGHHPRLSGSCSHPPLCHMQNLSGQTWLMGM